MYANEETQIWRMDDKYHSFVFFDRNLFYENGFASAITDKVCANSTKMKSKKETNW